MNTEIECLVHKLQDHLYNISNYFLRSLVYRMRLFYKIENKTFKHENVGSVLKGTSSFFFLVSLMHKVNRFCKLKCEK